MDSLLRRGYEACDAPVLAELMNAVDPQAGHTAQALDGLIGTLVRDPRRDAILVLAGDGTAVGCAFTTTPPAGGYRVYLTGGVHPAWRGRGIGRDLMRWQIDRAREIHRGRGPGVRWEGQLRTCAEDRDTARLALRLGLAPGRYWFEMSAPACPAVRPPGVVAFTPHPGIEVDLHAAHHEAFAGNWGFQVRDVPGWAALTVRSPTFAPELSALAYRDGALAGYALAYSHADPRRAYVGQVGVRPPWRGRGLAGALLRQVLAAAASTGRHRVGLSVDAASPTGAVGVYERAGFTVDSRAVTYTIAIG